MARPLREPPTRYGVDARRFEEDMRRVESMSPEQRRANREDVHRKAEAIRKKRNSTYVYQAAMRLTKITPDHEIKPFDCGNADLDGFFVNDAESHADRNIAHAAVLEDDEGNAPAYHSLLNDKVSLPASGFANKGHIIHK